MIKKEGKQEEKKTGEWNDDEKEGRQVEERGGKNESKLYSSAQAREMEKWQLISVSEELRFIFHVKEIIK